uniref:hypothetical protein n=1 Tax=Anaerovibrio sp. TaxID=1872532 RepID=UPI0025FCB13E
PPTYRGRGHLTPSYKGAALHPFTGEVAAPFCIGKIKIKLEFDFFTFFTETIAILKMYQGESLKFSGLN